MSGPSPIQLPVSINDIIPVEIIYHILKFAVSGVNRVLSACVRMVCRAWRIVRPVRIQYVIINLAAIKYESIFDLLYAYNYNTRLCDCVLYRYAALKKIREYYAIKSKITSSVIGGREVC